MLYFPHQPIPEIEPIGTQLPGADTGTQINADWRSNDNGRGTADPSTSYAIDVARRAPTEPTGAPRFRAPPLPSGPYRNRGASGVGNLQASQVPADCRQSDTCEVPGTSASANFRPTWTSIPKITPDTVIPCHPRESGEKAGIQLQPAYVFVPDGVLAHMDFFSENNARSKTGTKASPKGRPLLRTCSLVCSAPLQQCIEFYISPACLSWGCILMRDGSYVIRF